MLYQRTHTAPMPIRELVLNALQATMPRPRPATKSRVIPTPAPTLPPPQLPLNLPSL